MTCWVMGANILDEIMIPKEYKISHKQFGKKWGKHKHDYPNMNMEEYKKLIENVFRNHDKIIYDKEKGEFYYISGEDLLRIKENGCFVSMYRGANSERVLRAIDNGGIVWQK